MSSEINFADFESESVGMGSSSSDPCSECGSNCCWTWDPNLPGWSLIKACDDPNTVCNYPETFERVALTPTSLAHTCSDCYPFQLPSSSTGFVRAASVMPSTGLRVHARLPDVNQPQNWFSFAREIPPQGSAVLAGLGWRLFISHFAPRPIATEVIPAALPAHGLHLADRALAASVALPEQLGMQQYWLTVSLSRRWSLLRTPEWDILFMV